MGKEDQTSNSITTLLFVGMVENWGGVLVLPSKPVFDIIYLNNEIDKQNILDIKFKKEPRSDILKLCLHF